MASPEKKILEFPNQELKKVKAPKAPAVELEKKAQRLQDEIFEAFRCRRKARRYTAGDLKDCESVIGDFLSYSKKALWECDELDFDRWATHLGHEREVTVGSQRKYQASVRVFYDFILGSTSLMTKIQVQFGVRLRQVATDENCIPHTKKREVKESRPAMTPKEVSKLFESLDSRILMASRFGSKSLYPLMRDRFMFSFLYNVHLRISEGNATDLDSFQENPQLPEMGNCGFIATMRKGSKGSGKKFQMVPTDNPDLVEQMDWYLKYVRHYFAARQKPHVVGEPLFLTERGDRMTYGAANANFKKALEMAGIKPEKYSLHSLRRTGATHEVGLLSILAIQHKLGHANLETTMEYLDIPDEFIRDEISRAVRSRINAAKTKTSKAKE